MPKSEDWWQRNWRWCVPALCLAPPISIVAAAVGFALSIFGAVKNSEPAQHAFATAAADPQVQSRLGHPVEQGWWVSGSIKTTGPSGTADLRLPISGPKASGAVYVVARKQAGRWHYHELSLAVDGETRRLGLLE